MIRQITDEIAISGQIRSEDFPEIVQGRYRAILNLRSPNELGFLQTEPEDAAASGLLYSHCSTRLDRMAPAVVLKVIQTIKLLPKPLLIHCDTGLRSSAIALIYLMIQRGTDLDVAYQKVLSMGLFPAPSASERSVHPIHPGPPMNFRSLPA